MSHTGSWSWDARTGKSVWSDEHYRIFGADTRDGALPTLRRMLRLAHPEDRPGIIRAAYASRRNRAPFSCECRLNRPDGIRYVRIAGHPELDESGHLKRYIGTTIDLTEQRRTQEALQAAQSDLVRASRLAAIGELTSMVAHEIRQPLTAIAAKASACRFWLAHDPPNVGEVAAAAAAARIAGDAHRASSVIESIHGIARKSAASQASVDLNDVVSEAVTLLTSEFRRQRVLLRTDLADDLRLVLGDRVQLQQVIINLIMNGIEAMANVCDRPKRLWVSTKYDSSRGVVVEIRDVGVGLPAENSDKIFDAFFTTKPTGLGVGLAICRSFIEAHKGKLWALPGQSNGSTCGFALPILAPGYD